jgi:hypothetical protein
VKLLRLAALLLALAAGAGATLAQADGEAGLVLQAGDAVETYCVPFKGDSITGTDLLNAAMIPFERFGGSAQVLCSIRDVGCFNASDFDSCFCRCKSGDANCTYWAFFTQRYGGTWVYSATAFSLARARDGDVHGWKWGAGGPSSAPLPAPISFEQICGHPPRGGVQPPTPTAVGTTVAPVPATSSPLAATATSTQPAAATSDAQPPTPSSTVTASEAAGLSPTVRITFAPSGPGAQVEPGSRSGGAGSVIAFTSVAGALVLGTLAAAAWRRSRGR